MNGLGSVPRRLTRLAALRAAGALGLAALLAAGLSSTRSVGTCRAEPSDGGVPAAGREAGFPGWQGMRIIPVEGRVGRLSIADLGGDGRDEVIVVNSRQARIDLYRWLPPEERTRGDAGDPDRPNELPLAADWSHGEVSIDETPVDAITHDLDEDGRPELLVLTMPSHRVSIFTQSADLPPDARNAWKRTGEWNLLPGKPVGRGSILLVRDLPAGGHELLVSCEQGIQQLPLEAGGRSAWLSPREHRGRNDWQLADLDGDGDADLVEWSATPRQVVRWHECGADGHLLPAQTIHEPPIEGFAAAGGPGHTAASLLLLGGSDKGMLRRYALVRGAPTAVGRQDALPLANASRQGWCGMRIADAAGSLGPAVVAVDAAQPRLRVHGFAMPGDHTAAGGSQGWLPEQSFPAIGGIRGLAAPLTDEPVLLVWAKDAADLHECRWDHGRLTYPQPRVEAGATEGAERRILALDTVGSTVWWAQRIGADVDLFVWPAGAAEPVRTRYADLGAKVEQVVWLGDDAMIVQDAYAANGRLVRLVDGRPVVTSPALLAKFDAAEYLALEVAGGRRKARLTDGVLQWLGDDLHPVDQVMLGDGQKIASFLPVVNPDPTGREQAWALEQGGGFLHRLEADEAGVMRVVESVKPPAGVALRGDPVLGVVLVDQERIVRLSEGGPWELELLESIDGRVGRRSGMTESTIHRILVTDLDGDGADDVVLCDDRRHELTALLRTGTGLERSVSWRVFDDRKYPYDGGESKDLVAEPRLVAALDADGDGRRDLVLVSHDRLLVYLGRDPDVEEGINDRGQTQEDSP